MGSPLRPLNVELPNPQDLTEGEHQFSPFLRLKTSDRDQYYLIAGNTILFYDFLLTLADEVSYVTGVSLY